MRSLCVLPASAELTAQFEFVELDLKRFQDTVADHIRAKRQHEAELALRAQRFEFAVRDDDDELALDSDSDEDMPMDEPSDFPMPSAGAPVQHSPYDRALSPSLVASLTRQLVRRCSCDMR